jgi:hypothetical protein
MRQLCPKCQQIIPGGNGDLQAHMLRAHRKGKVPNLPGYRIPKVDEFACLDFEDQSRIYNRLKELLADYAAVVMNQSVNR